ncbi:MAG: beta-glucosidase [Rhodanobacter sp. 68-29]|nr:exo 1,3/1,4-beta-D-glucan glucohydrolase [Rhodanobacter sp.]ODU76116.1 MAG: beta-glucosidase [Rhodanobacter sp. SCN 69-32]OJY62331.1 MAG: beta-glucosidase [Rhodanobacter sp. 68-29]
MDRRYWRGLVCIVFATAGGAALAAAAGSPPRPAAAPAHYTDWPAIKSPYPADPALDARVAKIVAGMTLAQKVGQMTQAEIKSITPDEVRKYYIGSVLNGGGSWPHTNKHAGIQDWLQLADAYHDASMRTDMAVKIPIIWGIDAVHGNSNLFGATQFPHNIGLGAAHDVELVREIGAATAKAVRATGVNWAFAPTVAVAENPRWGRSYESFSTDPALVHDYARAYVEGLQGDFGPHNVLATAKHFIGDGSTFNGKDQGESRVDQATMINVHGAGYYGALAAGVQSVMVSYNSWNDVAGHVDYGKLSGARALVTGALKDKMDFDGLVVSDWNAIGQLPGCTNASCPQAVNAGMDMVMVPDDWKAFIANTMRQVKDGQIPMARIDDAVSRIIRVKLRMGLFDGKRPSQLPGAGDAALLQDRALARRAVRESLVLLKNNHDVLPLKRGMKILVVGKSADSLPNQSGGWSLTWQGTDNTNADFPNGETILAGLREADGDADISYSATAQGVDFKAYDAIVAVIGETPYAEMMGDIAAAATLRHSDRYPEDLAVLKAAAAAHKPVVTVFVAGRPLFVNDLLNLSDAFVAAWLPGTEGGGVADVLFARTDGKGRDNFRGTLAMPWPGVPCPAVNNDGITTPPLFAPGYGLRYPGHREVPVLPTHSETTACAKLEQVAVFHTLAVAPYALYLAGADAAQTPHELGNDLNGVTEWPAGHPLLRVRTVQVNTQQDAKQVTWLAPARFFARSAQPADLAPMLASHGALQFDLRIDTPATAPVALVMGCGKDCSASIDVTQRFAGYATGQRQSVSIPLACFASRGANLAHVDMPFGVVAAPPFAAAFANVRIVAAAGAKGADANCPGSGAP